MEKQNIDTCVELRPETLISVPNTLVFFLYICFFLLFLERKQTHLRPSGEVNPVLRTGEDLFCCLWQSIQKFLFLNLVVFCLVNYFILQTIFFSMLCSCQQFTVQRKFSFFQMWLENIPFERKKIPFALFKKRKKESQAVQYVAFSGNSQHCTVGSLIMILNVF